MKKSLLALASIGLAASAANAQPNSTHITFNDLNLSSPQGQAALERRIDRAAREICGLDNLRLGTRIRDAKALDCFNEARTKAHAQVAIIVERSAKGG